MSYPFAAGKIRVWEKRLLSQNDLDMMANAKNAEDAFAVFNDTDLADNLLKVEAKNFGRAISEDLLQNRKMIEEMVDDKNLIKLIFSKYDFHNLKVLLKAKSAKSLDFEKMILPLGTINLEDLKKRILENQVEVKLDEDFKEILLIIEKELEKDASSCNIDIVCDKAHLSFLIKIAKKIKNKFILDFCKIQIDLANLKVFFRSRFLKRDVVEKDFIDGGKIFVRDLISLEKKTEDEIKKFIKLNLKREEEKFFEDYFSEGKLWQLEKAFDDLMVQELKKTKFIPYGPELVFAFAFSKFNASNNMRLVMAGKWNEIEVEEVKKRLRKIF